MNIFLKMKNVAVMGFKDRIWTNALACTLLGMSCGVSHAWLRFLFVVVGALLFAETWYQFGYKKGAVISALKSR